MNNATTKTQRQQQARSRRNARGTTTPPQTQGLNNPVPNMAVVKRNFMQLIPETALLSEATTSSESFLGVGSYFNSISLAYALRNFLTSTSGVPIVYDQYKFDEIEVWAQADSFLPPYRPITVISSVDYDDTNSIDWAEMSQRNATKTVVLSVTRPAQMVAKFKPRANFISAVGDNPSNRVPGPGAYFDLSVTNQNFNGIKLHSSCQNQGSVRYYAKAKISFRGKI